MTMAATRLPNVDLLRPRMLGIDEHRFRSVRFFKDSETSTWKRIEPWMTTIVDLDTSQILGVVDGRDHTGVGAWLIKRLLDWRLGVQAVAIDPSASFRKALRMLLPRTAVSVDHFHLIQLAHQALAEVRQQLSHQVRGRRGRAVDPPRRAHYRRIVFRYSSRADMVNRLNARGGYDRYLELTHPPRISRRSTLATGMQTRHAT